MPPADTLWLAPLRPADAADACQLPQFRQLLQTGDSTLTHIALAPPDGLVGTPRPYTVRTDNLLTLVVLLCFIVLAAAAAGGRRLLALLARSFFRPQQADSSATAPAGTRTLCLPLMAVGCMAVGVASFAFVVDIEPFLLPTATPILVVALFTAATALYLLLKWLVYALVNTVFFGGKKTQQWSQAFLFLSAMESLAVFPMMLLIVYFDLEIENAAIYAGFVLFLNKMLTIYKTWTIFFKQKSLYLQNFLYFCALEIAPLAAFAGAWRMIAELLKVIF